MSKPIPYCTFTAATIQGQKSTSDPFEGFPLPKAHPEVASFSRVPVSETAETIRRVPASQRSSGTAATIRARNQPNSASWIVLEGSYFPRLIRNSLRRVPRSEAFWCSSLAHSSPRLPPHSRDRFLPFTFSELVRNKTETNNQLTRQK